MNFEILKEQIEKAAKKAFLEIYEQHGSENIYSFALYSDEGAMTVCPASNTLEMLKHADENDQLYYKYEPAEWAYEMEGAHDEFNEICTQLRTELEKNEDDDWFYDFQSKLYSVCTDVLEKLKKENFFSSITGRDIFLIFTVTDYEFEDKDLKDIIIRLNDNEYKDEYLEWMNTWGN
ncbi:hypothetical protein C1637_08155 [Chryseobacterium lactis]|uniref:DUF4303 domain-containing protein n=1 Tax=Chryseobacterium lactis TaxID=1241981 RepID=A0A3G6RCU3_CHRLC|nr:DUF4303 domain-containing protein [Chryseobacterium lactis]AZA82490.1 DUF4303 domain-containing protein [Chryseobacterium lactis]AZB02872.1 DUF4303 domain-containing protein [Chryseobacterium lactis]PNW13834.1 hypothetical protein C1637_08155 [Chryseobacterium lactis]